MEDAAKFKTSINYVGKSDVPYKVTTLDYESDYVAVLTFASGGNLVIETRRFSEENKEIHIYVCEGKKCEDENEKKVSVKDVSGKYFRLAQGFCYALPKRMEKNHTAFCGELLKR